MTVLKSKCRIFQIVMSKNINSDIFTGMGISMQNCSVGSDGAVSVKNAMELNDLGADDRRSDVVTQWDMGNK